MVGLQFMAAVHRLVLTGDAPHLVPHYPSAGGDAGVGDAWPAFHQLVASRLDDLRRLVRLPVQTNEPGRCAALLGGFLMVAGATGLPLRVLEIGASAGLNLRWDRYFYDDADGRSWGQSRSPVRLTDVFAGPGPRLQIDANVVERRGCDLAPLDPANDEDRLTLRACVWADQPARFALLDAALALAASDEVAVERAGAAEWLEAQLAEPRPGAATVVYQSLVWQYLPHGERARVADVLAAAGARASALAPLAWLRMEPGGELANVHLRRWPNGEDALVARAGYHGRPVHWLAD